MTDLTEQWKKGELPVGEYYLLYKDGWTTDREYYDWANVYGRVTEKGFSTDPNDIEKVLAPVPSYEEWQAKLEENTQLKELLEWCRDELFEVYSNEVSHPEDVPIIKKLDEVLK